MDQLKAWKWNRFEAFQCARQRHWETWTYELTKPYSQVTQTSHNSKAVLLDDTKFTRMETGNNNWRCLWAVFRAIYGKGKWFCWLQWKPSYWDIAVSTVTFQFHSHTLWINLGPLSSWGEKSARDRKKKQQLTLFVSLSSKTHWCWLRCGFHPNLQILCREGHFYDS